MQVAIAMANLPAQPYSSAIVNSAFLKEFLLVLRWRPMTALTGLYWNLTRRKVRARNVLRAALADAPFAYRAWIIDHEGDAPCADDVARQIDRWSTVPTFGLIILAHAENDRTRLRRALASVREQTYPHRELFVVGASPADDLGDDVTLVSPNETADLNSEIAMFRAAARRCDADFVLPLSADDALARNALFWIAQTAVNDPNAWAIYADHDLVDDDGRRNSPWLKPKWSADQAYSQDYISPAVALKRTLVAESQAPDCAGPAGYALTLDVAAQSGGGDRIVHCPRVAVHCRSHPDQAESRPHRKAAVIQHIGSTGAMLSDGRFGAVDVIWPLPPVLPLVTVVVPTRDRLELLEPCLRSVLERTDYPRFEVIVVDNGSTDCGTLRYLDTVSADPRVRVLRDDRPYNFAGLNNAAFHSCGGDVLCMLNNDTEVVAPGWLTAMVRQAIRPSVGAVGAKLLYADGTIQHAGVVIGMGAAAGHAHRNQRDDDPGYFLQAHIQRRATAVTAACLVVERSKFEAVGGLDEATFAVAFNDVDFCLKLDAAGLTNIYEPNAVLWHYESQSRGSDSAPGRKEAFARELAALQGRWGTAEWIDEMHHSGLDRLGETYRLGFDSAADMARSVRQADAFTGRT